MKPDARPSETNHRHKYTKVLDHRKQPIRGLRRRNGSFQAQIATEDEAGRKKLVWAPLAATTQAGATAEFKRIIT